MSLPASQARVEPSRAPLRAPEAISARRSARLDPVSASPKVRILPFRASAKRDGRIELGDDFSETRVGVEGWSDEELVREARRAPDAAPWALDALFRRYQKRVAAWCWRVSGRREEAADLAQEVFLRVHERLDQFRFESSFGTWLYLVTRSVAINRSIANRRRDTDSIDEESFLEPADPAPGVHETVAAAMQAADLRAAIAEALDPIEAKILHLHFVDELPLAGIDRLLGLENKSGAKAYIVSAKRKLKRYFAVTAAAPKTVPQSGRA